MAPGPPRDDGMGAIHQTIGALNAKADASEKNQTEIKSDLKALQTSFNALPDQIEEIVKRIIEPTNERLKVVEKKVEDVQMTVQKWKAILGVISAAFALLGFLLSHFIPLKKWTGFE